MTEKITQNQQIPLNGKERANNMEVVKKVRAKPVTKSSRAGVVFPVGKIHRLLKNQVSFNFIKIKYLIDNSKFLFEFHSLFPYNYFIA